MNQKQLLYLCFLTDAENNEPGLPTCPNFTSTEFAAKLKNKDENNTTIILLNLFILFPSSYYLFKIGYLKYEYSSSE